jgi:hypothetical protein
MTVTSSPRSRALAVVALLPLTATLLLAQTPGVTPLSPTLARSEGVDSARGIRYTRLYLTAQADSTPTAFDLAQPTLTVQCTQHSAEKYQFELFVNFGRVTDIAYYPPWRRADHPGELFAPVTEKIPVTMEFLGYTKVNPAKRQFEMVVAPANQLRYNSPGGGSSNLDEVAYYFQFLRALPTFRLSYPGHSATFLTEPLLAQIRKEPLCRASGL